MIYAITFDPAVKKTIAKWKRSNPILFKKLVKILNDIMEHPRTGLGHPEPLIGGGDIRYWLSKWRGTIMINNKMS